MKDNSRHLYDYVISGHGEEILDLIYSDKPHTKFVKRFGYYKEIGIMIPMREIIFDNELYITPNVIVKTIDILVGKRYVNINIGNGIVLYINDNEKEIWCNEEYKGNYILTLQPLKSSKKNQRTKNVVVKRDLVEIFKKPE